MRSMGSRRIVSMALIVLASLIGFFSVFALWVKRQALETDTWTERKDKSVRIEQTIFVERESQRKIVLGKGGATIKSIGADSRKEIAEIVGQPVHLFLFVKVRERWGDDPERYREMGLEFPKE